MTTTRIDVPEERYHIVEAIVEGYGFKPDKDKYYIYPTVDTTYHIYYDMVTGRMGISDPPAWGDELGYFWGKIYNVKDFHTVMRLIELDYVPEYIGGEYKERGLRE